MVKDINIEDFNYNLPEERIPLHPLSKRDECKLLLRSPEGNIYHRKFKELADLLPVGTLLICNDTRVINARMLFHKPSGAAIELFLLEPVSPSDYALNFQSDRVCVWKCLVGNSKKWKEGEISTDVPVGSSGGGNENEKLTVNALRLVSHEDGSSEIRFSWNNPEITFGRIVELAGKIPIPPYLNRDTEDSDKEDYQTVYARYEGSVAAPTAGLHFTPQVFESLAAHNIETGKVTLHVGAGTFRPVKSRDIGRHVMHSEPFEVTRGLLKRLIEWKRNGKPVIAVGTTSVRTLESLPYIGKNLLEGKENPYFVEQWSPYEDKNDFDTLRALEVIVEHLNAEGKDSLTASTAIIIAPGYKWRITNGMVTNFHQPKSTLLLLVSAFLDRDDEKGESWRRMYEEALTSSYRFLSYGDACLLLS